MKCGGGACSRSLRCVKLVSMGGLYALYLHSIDSCGFGLTCVALDDKIKMIK